MKFQVWKTGSEQTVNWLPARNFPKALMQAKVRKRWALKTGNQVQRSKNKQRAKTVGRGQKQGRQKTVWRSGILWQRQTKLFITWKYLKLELYIMASRGRLHWYQRDVCLYISLWENNLLFSWFISSWGYDSNLYFQDFVNTSRCSECKLWSHLE